jgi:hypothetical protein
MEQARRDAEHIDDHHRRLTTVCIDGNIRATVAVRQ